MVTCIQFRNVKLVFNKRTFVALVSRPEDEFETLSSVASCYVLVFQKDF